MNFLQPLAHVVAKFFLDGKEYEIEHFNIGFNQPVDYKGQPQHEMKGGQLIVTITQAADDNIYDWAKRSTKVKDGLILFQTEMSSPVLKVDFSRAYCIRLTRSINALSGTSTTLVLAPELVIVNGIEHNNFWKN